MLTLCSVLLKKFEYIGPFPLRMNQENSFNIWWRPHYMWSKNKNRSKYFETIYQKRFTDFFSPLYRCPNFAKGLWLWFEKECKKTFWISFSYTIFSSLLLVMSKQIAKSLREQNWVALIIPNEARGKNG